MEDTLAQEIAEHYSKQIHQIDWDKIVTSLREMPEDELNRVLSIIRTDISKPTREDTVYACLEYFGLPADLTLHQKKDVLNITLGVINNRLEPLEV